jgi:hypothetical protein
VEEEKKKKKKVEETEKKEKKKKVYSITCLECPNGKQRYSSTLSLTSELDRGGWLMPHPVRFTAGNDPRSASGPV